MKQATKNARKVARHIIPLGIGAACLWALNNQLSDIDFGTLWASVKSVSLWQWALALLFTAISFFAIARYDVVAHRHFQTGISGRRATITGGSAVALGQTLGMGAVVGGFVRWRMLSGLGVVKAAKITAFVTLCFMAAWAIVTSAAIVVAPMTDIPLSVPMCALVLAVGLMGLTFFKPSISYKGKRIELPTVKAMVAMLALCLVDTLFAAATLWVLLPAGVIDLTIAQLFPIYMLALGAALLSGTPGGVGPFELSLLALLPFAPEAELMAAIVAFRVVYYAVPAIIGGVTLLRPMATGSEAFETEREVSCLDKTLTKDTARAELGVVRQNGGAIVSLKSGTCGVVRTGQTLTSIFDPVHNGEDFAKHLRAFAREQNRIVCKYKITAPHAIKARKAGWAVLRVSDEAMVDPAGHTLEGSPYRQLRRKLKKAEKEGVQVVEQSTGLPFSDMKRVSEAWESRNGGAKGLSMGQFEEDYIQRQRTFLAWKEDELVGFVTFHTTGHEWALDLMRIAPGAPDGTMHLMVNEAILMAREENVPNVSLAAAPVLPKDTTSIEGRLRTKYFEKAGGKGLRQFKDCFNPTWQPLYMAAPGPAQLVIAAFDLIRSIKHAKPVTEQRVQALPATA
ncbi:bifunctional lysylphosphatidylglycerol flippase/synthetase MprF [Cognatishimia sp.]|uniref:bifunctional lysylphosphatidylglycerol flippase/synthetase MprF n=1 Tax=Cognatishimia sp. TaxID=2211648 RepID=UPI00351746DC